MRRPYRLGRLTRERQHIASEAARLMVESGLQDRHLAARQAARRLGIDDAAALPDDGEIADALSEYQRLFTGAERTRALMERRHAAVEAMAFFETFSPRLVGSVLDGTADNRAPVALHLHSDDPAAVARFIEDQRIPARARMHRIQLDRHRSLDVDVWTLTAGGLEFELSVLPVSALRQPPLAPGGDRPVARATLSRLRQLLESDAQPRT